MVNQRAHASHPRLLGVSKLNCVESFVDGIKEIRIDAWY